MVVETQVIPYARWLFSNCGDGESALRHFLMAALVLLAISTVVAYLVASFRHGPRRAALLVARALGAGVVDIVRMSPRRLFGLAGLAVREAFRRYIWIALVVFVVILLFTGWFLNPHAEEPAKLYLSNLLTWATYLMLGVALYLSSLSLPTDIKNRTIYTIVTKPVRASEIVLGRILGFTFASTVLLVIMAIASYLFVARSLAHTHEIAPAQVHEVRQNHRLVSYNGETSLAADHRHTFSIPADSFSPGVELASKPGAAGLVVRRVTAGARAGGLNPGDVVTAIDAQPTDGADLAASQERLLGPAGSTVRLSLRGAAAGRSVTLTRTSSQVLTDPSRGHWHRVIARWADGKLSYEVGPAEGMLSARVPIYGTLRFRDRQGQPDKPNTWQFRQKGISVGKLFTYRSYVEGNTMAAAVWRFDGLREEDFPHGLPLDITLRVYRSYMGKISAGITGSWQILNPANPTIASRKAFFTANDTAFDRIQVPTQLIGTRGQRLSLFKNLAAPSAGDPHERSLDVLVQCAAPGQYFGMARADLYVRAPDGSYTLNFCKAFVEVWLQVVVVTALAVFCSTFLSGPVAILLTVTTILLGFCSDNVYYLTNCVIYRVEMNVIEHVRRAALSHGQYIDAAEVARQAAVQKASVMAHYSQLSLEQLRAQGLDENQINGIMQFIQLNIHKLQTAQAMGLDQASVLDRVYGGGPLEAFYRLVTQQNQVVELDKGWGTSIVQHLDTGMMHALQYVDQVVPDFLHFGDTNYLASGYNIRADLVLEHATTALGFVIAAFVAGYFVMKYREVAR